MKKSFVLLYIALFLVLAFSVAAAVKSRLRQEEEPLVPEPTINPNLIHALSDYQSERENLGFQSGDESEHLVLPFIFA